MPFWENLPLLNQGVMSIQPVGAPCMWCIMCCEKTSPYTQWSGPWLVVHDFVSSKRFQKCFQKHQLMVDHLHSLLKCIIFFAAKDLGKQKTCIEKTSVPLYILAGATIHTYIYIYIRIIYLIYTLPETNIAHENPIFPGKYHQNGGFSMAMLVSGSVHTDLLHIFTTFPDLLKPKLPNRFTVYRFFPLQTCTKIGTWLNPDSRGVNPLLEVAGKVGNSEWEPMIHILDCEIMHAYVYVYVIYMIYVHNRTTNIILIIGQVTIVSLTFGYY